MWLVSNRRAPILVYNPSAMVTKNPGLADCPTCRATGRVDSRLPFRQKVCVDCGGKARIAPAKREQILKRLKQREQA